MDSELHASIGAEVNKFINAETAQNRLLLNRETHICDVSMSTLLGSLPGADVQDIKALCERFIEVLTTLVPPISGPKALEAALLDGNTLKKNFNTVFLFRGDKKILIANNNRKLRILITQAEKIVGDSFKTHIEHGSSTPITDRIDKFKQAVQGLGANNAVSTVLKEANRAIKEITTLHGETTTTIKNNVEFLRSTEFGALGKELFNFSVKVTIGNAIENSRKGNAEKEVLSRYLNKLRTSSFREYITEKVKKDGYSIKIRNSILNTIEGTTGDLAYVYQYMANPISIETSSTTSRDIGNPSLYLTDYVRENKFGEKGRFAQVSLSSLHEIIKIGLQEKLASNMGTNIESGTSHHKSTAARKDVLNIVSTNFIRTTKVEGLGLSATTSTSINGGLVSNRDSQIEVFYKYMKYHKGGPHAHAYDTFEPGNKQDTPLSRNPILLVEKSVRELISPFVSNRLRMIPV